MESCSIQEEAVLSPIGVGKLDEKSTTSPRTWMFVSSKPLQSCLNCMSGALV